MSLPREILDQLLSGYLDDSLNADERARVERLLETDPEFARELEELRGIRGWLKDVAKADEAVKLPNGFSDRVLDAAIACAKSEGLSEDHPLVRLAEQPSTQPGSTTTSSPLRMATVLVALAASIVIAMFAFRPENPSVTPLGPEVALGPETPSVDPIDVPPELDPSLDPDPGTAVVAVDPKSTDPVITPDEPTVDPVRPEITDPPREAIVAVDPPNADPGTVAPEMVANNVPAKRGEIIVVDIRLTAKGRETGAVKKAMLAAGITPESEKQITNEIVGLAQQATGGSGGVVIYLQAFGKDLDKLYLEMFEDNEGIESIGLGLNQDAPLLGMVDAFHKLDATLVRHEVTWKLASDSDIVQALATDLGKRSYVPMSRKDAKGAAAALSAANNNTKGQDFPSQLILLVR